MAETSRVPNRPDSISGFGCSTESGTQAGAGLVDKAKDVASSVAEKVGDAASTVRQTAQEAASYVGERASDAASAVGHGVSAGAEYVRDTAGSAATNLTQLIRRHPIPALLVAFATGLLIARVSARR
jgi:ElaB/YqjD/DUF883 family membrane-anchored ribosome-binding protein